MRRREFITLLGGAAVAWPLVARAQQASMPVIGYIGPQPHELSADRLGAFQQGLNEAGYIEGRNVAIEYRWADNQYDRIPGFITELIGRRVAVIAMAGSTPGAIAAKSMNSPVPVVFSVAGDPVQLGLVASLNRPGGNFTGMTVWNAPVVPKRMEFLHELVPTAITVGLLTNPTSSSVTEDETKYAQTAAGTLGLQLHLLNASSESEIAAALGKLARRGRSALLVGSDVLYFVRREQVAALAAQHALPAMYDRREFAVAGGLMSYGSSILDVHRWVGIYVGRILKGEKPADLPVMLPTKYELVINLKTAKVLGVKISDNLLSLADEVIE
jgi:putative tryptophan/tyrosine transport system substrate-binding protein